MTKTKTIAEFERERGIMLQGKIDPDKRVTADEFDETMQGTTWVGVDHLIREQWLKDNGYDVTRDNMADGSLQPRRVTEPVKDSEQSAR